MSDPIAAQLAGPSWRVIGGWALAAFAFSVSTVMAIARIAWGWIPGKVGRMAADIAALQKGAMLTEAELAHQRALAEADKSGERLGALEARMVGLEGVVGKFDAKLDRILESRTEGGSP